MWLCLCDCGNQTIVETQKLRSGHTKSCGCLSGEPLIPGVKNNMLTIISRNGKTLTCLCDCGNTRKINQTNFRTTKSCGCININPSLTHGMTGTREYYAWYNAKTRCYYKKSKHYHLYGQRGITMCEAWLNSFEKFFSDMGPCPKDFTLERINVDGNYEPSNCKWIPSKLQARNKRNSLIFEGKHLKQIAEDRGISYYTLRMAMKRGKNPLTFTPRKYPTVP